MAGSDPRTGKWRVARGVFAFGGIARGVFAFGGRARGIFAFGGVATGFIAVGGVAIGVISLGGLALGLLLAFGGLGIGAVAAGGGAVGYYASGGSALGYYSVGGLAIGQYALGGRTIAEHVVNNLEHMPPVLQLLHRVTLWSGYSFVLFLPFIFLSVLVPQWARREVMSKSALKQTTANPSATPAGRSDEAKHSLRRTVILHAVLFGLVCAAFLIGVPRFAALYSDFQVALPPITRFILKFGPVCALLILPLMLGVDVAFCYLTREIGGPRGLRWWSGSVVVGLMLLVAISGAALWLPMRKVVVELNQTAGPSLTFGPVMEREVNDPQATREKSALSFDSGQLLSMPDSVTLSPGTDLPWNRDPMVWARSCQADAVAFVTIPAGKLLKCGLLCPDVLAIRADNDAWDQMTPAELKKELDRKLSEWNFIRELAELTAAGKFPATYLIQTRGHRIGILQITGVAENPARVKIRYKLVRSGAAQAAAVASAAQSPLDVSNLTDETLEEWLDGKDVAEVCFAGPHMEPQKFKNSLQPSTAYRHERQQFN